MVSRFDENDLAYQQRPAKAAGLFEVWLPDTMGEAFPDPATERPDVRVWSRFRGYVCGKGRAVPVALDWALAQLTSEGWRVGIRYVLPWQDVNALRGVVALAGPDHAATYSGRGDTRVEGWRGMLIAHLNAATPRPWAGEIAEDCDWWLQADVTG